MSQMRYSQGHGKFQSILPIKVKFHQILLCRYQNLHLRQQLNLVIDAYYEIRFGMVTQFFNTFRGEIITEFCE